MAETIPSIGEMLKGRDPTDEEQAIIDYVLSLANDWESGHIEIADVRRMSTGYDRMRCARFCAADAKAFPGLWAMFDALIDSDVTRMGECTYRTPNGWMYSTEELRGVPVRYARSPEGRTYPVFTHRADPTRD